MNEDDITEEQGFDEREELDDDERVTLEIDGVRRELILLAVIEAEDREYALLGEDGEGELNMVVARYDGALEGPARFSKVEDLHEMEMVRAALADFIELEN